MNKVTKSKSPSPSRVRAQDPDPHLARGPKSNFEVLTRSTSLQAFACSLADSSARGTLLAQKPTHLSAATTAIISASTAGDIPGAPISDLEQSRAATGCAPPAEPLLYTHRAAGAEARLAGGSGQPRSRSARDFTPIHRELVPGNAAPQTSAEHAM